MRSPKLLFLTKFTAINAYTRYRVCQYVPFLEQAGYDVVIDALFPDTYIERTYRTRSRSRALLTLAPMISAWLARRWWMLSRESSEFDIVYLQYEALPYVPLFFEQPLLQAGARIVVDFDDAISLNYEQHPNRLLRHILRTKIPGIVSESHTVIAANRNLAKWARQFNPNVEIIPNSVDLRKYPEHASQPHMKGKPIIGWIGTPITAKYLRLLERPLQALREQHEFVLKVIGAPDFAMDGVEVLAVPWNEKSEVDDLRTCDIGIMPLPNDSWARGKSALKVIQYLAAGIPAVAPPVGANCDVLSEGKNGFFALTDEQWRAKLALLIEDPLCRERIAEEGRRTVEECFSLQVNAPRLIEVLKRARST